MRLSKRVSRKYYSLQSLRKLVVNFGWGNGVLIVYWSYSFLHISSKCLAQRVLEKVCETESPVTNHLNLRFHIRCMSHHSRELEIETECSGWCFSHVPAWAEKVFSILCEIFKHTSHISVNLLCILTFCICIQLKHVCTTSQYTTIFSSAF